MEEVQYPLSKALGLSIMGARLFATMPNQKQNNPEIDIDQQIDDLVAGMTEATEKLEREIETANQPDEDFETESQIASAVQPDYHALDENEPKAADEPEAEEPASSLDTQIDEMLEDAAASVEVRQVSKSTVDTVDEELAELADEMLEGDFDDADEVMASGIEAPKPTGANPAGEPTESTAEPAPGAGFGDDSDMLEGDFDDAEEVIAQGEPDLPKVAPAPTAKPAPKPAAEAAPKAEPAPKAPAPEPVPAAAELDEEFNDDTPTTEPDRASRHKKRKGNLRPSTEGMPKWRVLAETAREHAGDAIYVVAEKLTKPLDSRPEMLKGLTGWLAAVTLFNAIAVWVFMLIARGPEPGTSDEPAVDLVGQQTNAAPQSESID